MNKYLFNQSQFNAPSVSLENGRFKVLLFSGTETLLGELNPDLCEIVESEVAQKDSTLDLSYPLNDDGYTLLKTAFSIAIPDMDYGWNVYDIVRMEEDLVGGLVKVYAENRFLELMTEPIITGSFASATPSDALPVILDGTRWGLRYVNITNQRTFDLVDTNPLKALRYCESDYDGYLKFTASIDDFGINGFFVDFLSRLGTVSGLEFDLSHNMDGITITTDKSGIVTAMYGRGPSQNLDPDSATETKLTFDDVLWDTGAGSPADKPVGQDWVGDETAKALYGKPDGAGGRKHIFGIHESQATTDSSLLQETWEVLQRNNAPKVNVEARVVDLERVTGFAHEKVRLGDTVKVKVSEFNHYLETEVISIKRDRMAPEKTVLEFGNFRNSLTDTVQSLSEKTNSLYGRQAIYDRAGVIKKEVIESELVYTVDGVFLLENAKFKGSIETEQDATIGESLNMPIYVPMTFSELLQISGRGNKGVKFGHAVNSVFPAFLTVTDRQYLLFGTVDVLENQRVSMTIKANYSIDLNSDDINLNGDVTIPYGKVMTLWFDGTSYPVTRDSNGFLKAVT